MKNIMPVMLEKYQDVEKYQSLENGIFKDLGNKRYVITLRFELEESDDFQYPLEDVLDKFYINCTDYIVQKDDNGVRILETELEDGNDNNYESLETIKEISSLAGKRVYNKEVDGYIKLIIE